MGKALPPVAVTLVVGFLAFASAARANWGPHGECGPVAGPIENQHCYGEVDSPFRRLYSATFEKTTALAFAPSPYGSELVNNEQWVILGEGWVEAGEQGQPSYQGLHPFFATYNTARCSGLELHFCTIYTLPTPVTDAIVGYDFFEISDPCACGHWYVGGDMITADAEAGWPSYSSEIRAGAELATYYQPEARGRFVTASANNPHTGPWAWPPLYEEHIGPVCQTGNPEFSNVLGDNEWWVC